MVRCSPGVNSNRFLVAANKQQAFNPEVSCRKAQATQA